MRFSSAARFGVAFAIAACGISGWSDAGYAGAPVLGPSFDCTNAMHPTEQAICLDPQLATIDLLIADAYKDFEPAYGGDKKTIARALIADRNACGSETACIAVAMANALQTYSISPAWVDAYVEGMIGKKALDVAAGTPDGADQAIPETLGSCAVTHIAELATRLGSEPLDTADENSGSRVSFSNGGTQVSYDRDQGLASSAVGDRVAICLVSIPRDCPAGDERGRVYYGVDLVRHGTWMLADSQHMCGGA